MTKQERFLKMAQTAITIMHLQKRGQGSDPIIQSITDMNDAIYASERIPDGMKANDAAEEFLCFLAKEGDSLKEGWEFEHGKWYLRT